MRRPPDWPATPAEFVAHAARDETLRQAYMRIRDGFLVAIADVIEALCEKHGLTLLVPPLEARRLEPRQRSRRGRARAGGRTKPGSHRGRAVDPARERSRRQAEAGRLGGVGVAGRGVKRRPAHPVSGYRRPVAARLHFRSCHPARPASRVWRAADAHAASRCAGPSSWSASSPCSLSCLSRSSRGLRRGSLRGRRSAGSTSAGWSSRRLRTSSRRSRPRSHTRRSSSSPADARSRSPRRSSASARTGRARCARLRTRATGSRPSAA